MSRGRKDSQEGVHGLQLCAPFHLKKISTSFWWRIRQQDSCGIRIRTSKAVERKFRGAVMNDKFRDDQASKPNAGIVKVHEGKKDYASPAAGVTEHPEKQVGHESGSLSKPNCGLHPTGKKDAARPSQGVVDERKDQKKFDETHDEHKRKRL
jgi:hypothetical protein